MFILSSCLYNLPACHHTFAHKFTALVTQYFSEIEFCLVSGRVESRCVRAYVRGRACVRACILIGPAFLAGESCLVTCRYLPILLATAYQDLPGLRKQISSSFIQHYVLCNTYTQEVTM